MATIRNPVVVTAIDPEGCWLWRQAGTATPHANTAEVRFFGGACHSRSQNAL